MPNEAPKTKPLLNDCCSVAEYGKDCNRSTAWAYEQVHNGLPVLKFGGRMLIHIPTANEYLAKLIRSRRKRVKT